MGVFNEFLFPLPSSMLMKSMCLITLVSLMHFALSEVRGKHLQYSKFWNTSSQQDGDGDDDKKKEKKAETGIKVSSKIGMLILYTPAFLAAAIPLWLLFSKSDLRFKLVASALTLHFFKRDFEVLFVHKYSGGMIIDSAIPISLSYFISTASMIYNQHLLQGVPEPSVDLKYAGVVLFSVSILGNFYHHYLLAKLRAKDGEGYKIPKGGLFGLIICPHYLFEILIFVGISLISQSVYPICFTVGTAMYLTGRSYATTKWYLSKFPNFPKHVKALIPFVY